MKILFIPLLFNQFFEIYQAHFKFGAQPKILKEPIFFFEGAYSLTIHIQIYLRKDLPELVKKGF